MLRLLHTADWHLGQSFHGFDRDHEHRAFLAWLNELLVAREIDALLIAGDVFDGVNPSADAQRMFYDFLARARAENPRLQIVAIAGNHDAAARLEAPSNLFAALGIHAVGTVQRSAENEIDLQRFLVPLRDRTGAIAATALAIPFLRPADVPLVPGAADPYLDGIRALYARATAAAIASAGAAMPLIALGHCHLIGGIESRDSERRIVIGGAEALGCDNFPAELCYVALGHLHRTQAMDGGRLRYCGSPIPLSFSEIGYDHSVLEVNLESGAAPVVTSHPIPRAVSMLRIPERGAAPLVDVLAELAGLPNEAPSTTPHPFLEVRVLDDGPDPSRRRTIEQSLAGKAVRLTSIRLEAPAREATQTETSLPGLADLNSLDPLEIMTAAHRERFGAEADGELIAAMQTLLGEITTP